MEILQRFVPTAAVLELDIEMFGVESKHRDDPQQFSGDPRLVLSPVPTDRFRPTLLDAVTETQAAIVVKPQNGLGKRLVHFDVQQ